MKKIIAFFTLLLCVSFSQEMSAQKIYYSLIGSTTLQVEVNGQPVLNITSTYQGSNVLNGELDITNYLVHTSSPWDIIEVNAYSNTVGGNPMNLFVGEYGLPTYDMNDEIEYNDIYTSANYSCTWALDANDMYIEVKASH